MTPFQYLNLENKWDGFRLEGLVSDDGVLRLASVPGQAEEIAVRLAEPTQLEGPAGIGVDEANNLYVADPARHMIVRVDGCDGSSALLPCLRGPGEEPGQLNGPRGVLVGPRNALYVADSGNHRVQVVDLGTQQVRAIWGQPDPYATPQPDSAPGRFDQPWDLAADAAGNVYVVDFGNRRVQKFDPSGRVLLVFWETMAAARRPQEPVAIAATLVGGEERLLLIDRADNAVLVYRTDGYFDAVTTEQWANVPAQLTSPTAVAADDDSLYVADASGRVLVFDREGTFLGVARAGRGLVAGLALDRQGRLLLHPGGGAAIQRLQPAAAYGLYGAFLAGPFTAGSPDTQWHRLQVEAAPLPEGTHVHLFTYTSNEMNGEGSNMPPLPAGVSAGPSPTTTGVDVWRAAPADALDFLTDHAPARYLWLAGIVQGDGTATPLVQQMHLSYDHEPWTRYLPSVHRRDPTNRAFLDRALSLFESLLADDALLIDDLPRLFDPWAAADVGAPNSWLDWLAGWLAFDLDETWSEAGRREALAGAFELYSRRGTVESLRQLIALYAGATAHIQEPARQTRLWSLGHFSTLGFDTMLVPAEAQGAVVGTTATLDRSHLIEEEEHGAPLFEDVAHRFCVQVYTADLAEQQTLDKVVQVVEREKPAHTTYHLCPIDAAMRIGFQARVGIDTIVAGASQDLVIDAAQRLGLETVLPERATGPAIGQGVRLGRQTRLT